MLSQGVCLALLSSWACGLVVPRASGRRLGLRGGAEDLEDFDLEAYKAGASGGGDDASPIDMSGGGDPSTDPNSEFFDLQSYLASQGMGDIPAMDTGSNPFAGQAPSPSGKTEGEGQGYVWQQTPDTMSVAVPIPEETSAKAVSVEYPTRTSVVLKLKGEDAPRLEGEICGAVQVDDSYWSLERDDGAAVVLDIAKASGSKELWRGFLTAEQNPAQAAVTKTCYFDVDIDGGRAGRVEIGLFGDDVPLTAANFQALCGGVTVDDKPYTYAGNAFHRVIPGFMCQGGDITNGDGTGGVSIYNNGGPFSDEKFSFSHVGEGLLSMANSGPNSNKSQFFITTGDCTWLDGKHVIFGRVTSGMDVVRKVEALGSASGDLSGEALIAASGVL